MIRACDAVSAVEDLLVPVDKRQRKNTGEDGRHVQFYEIYMIINKLMLLLCIHPFFTYV